MPQPVPISVSTRFTEQVPREFAREHLVIGAAAPADPAAIARLIHAQATDPLILHNIQVHLAQSLPIESADAELIARLIDESYSSQDSRADLPKRADRDGVPIIELSAADTPSSDLEQELSRLTSSGEQDLLALQGKGPVVRLVDGLFFEAIGRGASDIHVQPLADCTLVRYRLDGVLLTARRVSPRLAPAIVSRIKIMARLDIAERRAPQDGRATVTIGRGDGSRAIDLRIATLPSAYGERVVIRLLDTQRGGSLASLGAIGMPPDVIAAYQDRAGRSSGIVLLTGPTGSGKTTTLYATLRWIAGRSATGRRVSDVNIMTIEDPIEYDLSSLGFESSIAGANSTLPATGDTPSTSVGAGLPISQTQVDPKKNLTFATGLRHILRQDPDVIMVGEIRDADTARIAIQASLTGHLVFSTLHTADAAGAITRLIDLGIESYLVASSLSAVLAQRLVRLVHQGPGACGGKGCAECLDSGFKGRRGIFELLVIDSAIRQMIGSGASATEIRSAAVASGMKRLEEQGQSLVRNGQTTTEEVQRVTLGAE